MAELPELYRARVVATIGAKHLEGPWIEYGPTAVNGVHDACQASAERLFAALRSIPLKGEAEKRGDDGRWPSDA